MKLFLTALTICLLFINCQKDSSSAEEPTVNKNSFTTDKPSYNPFQIISVNIKKDDLNEGEKLKATLGTRQIDIVIVSDSSLVLVAPKELAGTSPMLSFTLKGNKYEGSLTIKSEAPLTDPEVYLNDFSNTLKGYLDQLKTQINTDTTFADKSALIESIKVASDSINSFNQALAVLQPSERAYVANFIKANFNNRPRFSEDFKNYNFGRVYTDISGKSRIAGGLDMNVLCNDPNISMRYMCIKTQFIRSLSELGQWIVITGAASIAAQGFPVIGTALGGVGAIMIVVELNQAQYYGKIILARNAIAAWNQLNAAYESVNEFFKTSSIEGSLTDINNNVGISFSFLAKYRNAQKIDEESIHNWLKEAMVVIKRYNDIVGKIGNSFTINIQTLSSIFKKPHAFGEISIVLASNSKVSLKELKGTVDKFEATFTTTETTPQDFEYDIVYTPQVYSQVRIRQKAKLSPISYKLGYLDGSAVPNTEIAFDKGALELFILLTEDGKAATGIDYNKISFGDNTNSNVTIEVTPLSSPQVAFGLTLNTTQTTKQTTSFDVLYNAQKVQTMAASVNDSTEYYKNLVLGTWYNTWDYDFNNNGSFSYYQTDKIILSPGGSAMWVESIDYTGHVSQMASNVGWSVYYDGSKYMMQLGAQTGRITPAQTFINSVSERFRLKSHR